MTPNMSVACRDGKENDSAHSASIFTCLSVWQGLALAKTSLMTCADTSLKTSANAAKKSAFLVSPPAFPESVNRNRNEHQERRYFFVRIMTKKSNTGLDIALLSA